MLDASLNVLVQRGDVHRLAEIVVKASDVFADELDISAHPFPVIQALSVVAHGEPDAQPLIRPPASELSWHRDACPLRSGRPESAPLLALRGSYMPLHNDDLCSAVGEQ